jgi:hypothetical protein
MSILKRKAVDSNISFDTFLCGNNWILRYDKNKGNKRLVC